MNELSRDYFIATQAVPSLCVLLKNILFYCLSREHDDVAAHQLPFKCLFNIFIMSRAKKQVTERNSKAMCD